MASRGNMKSPAGWSSGPRARTVIVRCVDEPAATTALTCAWRAMRDVARPRGAESSLKLGERKGAAAIAALGPNVSERALVFRR